MSPAIGNLFAELAPDAAGERFDRLVDGKGVTIERIVSAGQASPEGFWYDDSRDEWIVLLAGAAALEFEGEPGERPLLPGDHLLVPAHCRHRVAWTDRDVPTVWLAVFIPTFDAPRDAG